MAAVWGEFTGYPGRLRRGATPSPITPQSPLSLWGIDVGGVRSQLNRRCLLHPPSRRKEMGWALLAGAAVEWAWEQGGRIGRYSITMQHGRCWEKYLKSSGVAPGQLVSSSSSSSCSCTSPDSPVVVSKGQPARRQGALSPQNTITPKPSTQTTSTPKHPNPKTPASQKPTPQTTSIPKKKHPKNQHPKKPQHAKSQATDPSPGAAPGAGAWAAQEDAGAAPCWGGGMLDVPGAVPQAVPVPIPGEWGGAHRPVRGGAGCPCSGDASGQNPAPGKEIGVGAGGGQGGAPRGVAAAVPGTQHCWGGVPGQGAGSWVQGLGAGAGYWTGSSGRVRGQAAWTWCRILGQGAGCRGRMLGSGARAKSC